ncbi:MAG: hypothetical protein IKE55_11370 [Kiritimatiellae bacterium]|nr:hypothetical protein [Kiritimatiellia bacterium]
MYHKVEIALFAAIAALAVCAKAAEMQCPSEKLSVRETADGVFAVYRGGCAVVTDIRPALSREVPCRKSMTVLPDGSRVWNRWNEDCVDRFRFEIVERADGAVEMSTLGYCVGPTPNRSRTISFVLPGSVFGGKPYSARAPLRMSGRTDKGVFEQGKTSFESRYFAAEGLVFNGDPNPTGVYSYNGRTGVPGRWTVKGDGEGGFRVVGVACLPADGNEEAGDKMVIHPGAYDDYSKDHFLPYFDIYHWTVDGRRWHPLHLVKFGAPRAGSDYKEGNVAFNGTLGWGGKVVPQVREGNPSGAYYSHAFGRGKAAYRFAGLPPGWYIITFQIGNYTGESNAFSISVNGERLAKGISVGKGEARTIARAFHVPGGKADVLFEGDWIVSAIGVQPLLSDCEDFMMRRGFWYSEGYEPSVIRRNSYTRKATPATFDQTVVMPAPGQEAAGSYREPPKPIELADRSLPENQWMYKLAIRNVNLGDGASYYADDAKRARFVEESERLRYNAFMLHGNLCRHLQAEEHTEIVEREVLKFAKDAHEHDIKFIDHMDVTLAWANHYGFRALIEHLDVAMLDIYDNLPTYLLCPENPKWKGRFFKYLREKAAAGIDGFQLDELMYWWHGCSCGHCRAKFAAETGWSFPLDETDPSCRHQAGTRLYDRWSAWQVGNTTNWRVDLRRFLKDLNPNIYMSTYTTYGAQVGRRCLLGPFMETARTMSMLGTEVMQQDVMRCSRPLMSLARLKNVFRLAHGVPSWNWFYNSSYANECFAFAVCNMTGEVPLLTGSWLGAKYDPAFANPVEWAANSRPMDIAGAFPVAEVGLLFSTASCRRNEGDNCTPEILGLAQELEVMHVPYEFFSEVSCRFEQLRNYKVVFIGESQCLGDAEIGALQAFRASGGRIYGRPLAGTRNEFGERRKEPFDAFSRMSSAMPFYEEEAPVRGNDTKPRLVCDPAAEARFRAELSGYVADARWWSVKGAPDKLYTSVFREKSGAVVIHFLNATGCDLWKDGSFVSLKSKARYPQLSEDVVFDVPASVGDTAAALGPELGFGERPLDAVRVGDRLKVRVPREFLQVYAIVRFGFGGGRK